MERYSGLAVIGLVSEEARTKLAELRQRVVANNSEKQVIELEQLEKVERDVLVDALQNVWKRVSWWVFGEIDVETELIYHFLMESASSWLSYQGYRVWEKLTDDARLKILKFVFPQKTKAVKPA